jgi:hypothetical protein
MSGRQEKEICILFWWKYLKEKKPLGRPRLRCVDNMEIDPKC